MNTNAPPLKSGDLIPTVSLWQPWATAIALGAKRYETRSWNPRRTHLLAIHAAKHWTSTEAHLLHEFRRRLPDIEWPDEMPFGAVLCVCEWKAIHRTEDVRASLSPQELALGNYGDGRYAWELDVIHRFQPVPCVGAQSIWKWRVPQNLKFL